MTDIVFTGFGMLTSHGCGIEENLNALEKENTRTTPEEFFVRGFNPLPFLSDKKIVKVVSARDVLGLVAFETCQKNADIKRGNFSPERTGLYVGAPSSACTDNLNYVEAVEASKNNYGELTESEFGANFVSASPTTLLVGLPNNVLCYGSKIMDARGANSNYTGLELSSHMAVINGARAMRLGRLDCAMVGGYSGHSEELFLNSIRKNGIAGTPIAEGAVFTSMECRDNAEKRGGKILATFIAGALTSDARGPYQMNQEENALSDALERVLDQSGVYREEIGAVMLTGSGIAQVDEREIAALNRFFEDSTEKPLLATTAKHWGNLMEAGGLAEIAVLSKSYQAKKIPKNILISTSTNVWRENSPYGLILRSSPWGEYSAILIRCTASDGKKEGENV